MERPPFPRTDPPPHPGVITPPLGGTEGASVFIRSNHRGLAYGDGALQGDGSVGQVVRLVGADLFAVNTDPTQRSFGLLVKSYKAGEMPGVFCQGGIYETDVFEGTPAPGSFLKTSPSGKLAAGVIADGEEAIGQTISVVDGVLKFRLLV